MRQVLQPISGGPVEVAEVPRPTAGPTEVLVRTVASVISPGTERAVTALAQASLLAKARAPALCRDRAAVVIVGDVGLSLDRTPFYERELSLRFVGPTGPAATTRRTRRGRGLPGRPGALDRGPELRGGAGPDGRGSAPGVRLVTHRFDIGDTPAAYELIEKRPSRTSRSS